MTLRRKLLVTFGGLALVALVIVAVALWTSRQWSTSDEQLRGHYERSLVVQRLRADVFEASNETSDVFNDDPDARPEYEAAVASGAADFRMWSELAHTPEERAEVRRVRAAYNTFTRQAEAVFALHAAGRRQQGIDFYEDQLQGRAVERFEEVSDAAVAADRAKRRVLRAQTAQTRSTGRLVLAIAAIGAVSLVLLLAAYLASDLFAPLRRVRDALGAVAKGDLDQRLDVDRGDELGEVNRAFNAMAESIGSRQRAVSGLASTEAEAFDEATVPSRYALHRLVRELRGRVVALNDQAPDAGGRTGTAEELDRLVHAIGRLTEFGFPLDLNLSRTDVRALIYDVVSRHQDELVERAVSLEVDIAPDVEYAVIDRLKMREVLGELVSNALAALPPRGGRLGLRAELGEDGQLLLGVADDAGGIEEPLVDVITGARDGEETAATGLPSSRAIVERHGGRLELDTLRGQGTLVRIELPVGG